MAFGYTAEDMLPLNADRAVALFNNDHAIFMLYPDNTEAMAFEVAEIEVHDGIFGIEREAWTNSKEFAELSAQEAQSVSTVEQTGNETPLPRTEPSTHEIPKSEQPLYKQSADHALEHDELQAWRDSRDLNVECGKAIDKAIIDSNYELHRYDLSSAARTVIDEYGTDRVAWVLAGNIHNNMDDGRLSNEHKGWAKLLFESATPDVHLKTHLAVLDGFIGKFHKVSMEKPSLMAALNAGEKKSKAEFDGKAQPGIDAPDKSKNKKNDGMEV